MDSKQPKNNSVVELLERLNEGLVPDEELKELVTIQLEKRLRWGYKPTAEEQVAFHLDFINGLKKMEISGDTEAINSTSYEISVEFLRLMFGKALKQSACYFKHELMTIDEAETCMLDLYCERAQVKDGQTILDIGCGQGSLLFHIAQKFKNCHLTGITNSNAQKSFIDEQCRNFKLSNIEVILADVTKYETEAKFDRIFIIAALEHMKNIQLFLKKISNWAKEDGYLFVDHVCHRLFAEHFEALDEGDWYPEYLFLKGSIIVPAASTLLYFQDDVSVVNHWVLNGNHMSRSHGRWLQKLVSNREAAIDVLSLSLDGKDAAEKCINHCRTFHLAISMMYSYNNGEEWMISHFLLKKKMN